MSQRPTRSSAKGASRAGATSKNSNSGPASKEEESEQGQQLEPPKKQRRTSAQQTLAEAEAWQKEGEGAPQGDGRRLSKRTAASKDVRPRTEEEEEEEEDDEGLRAGTGVAYQTQFDAMKMLIASDEPWMFALDVEPRGDCWVMAMLACAPLATSNRDILGYAAVACRCSSVSHSAAT